jgi:hypothetical protein
MVEQERPPLDRRARLKRSLAVNAYWGLDGASHCHDIPTRTSSESLEVQEGDDHYIVSVDTESGELKFLPGASE